MHKYAVTYTNDCNVRREQMKPLLSIRHAWQDYRNDLVVVLAGCHGVVIQLAYLLLRCLILL